MTWDIVFPKNNETEFISLAKKLGYHGLVFCYQKLPEKLPKAEFPLTLVELGKQKGMLRIARADDRLRSAIEMKQADLFYDVETVTKKDYLHHRGSGLNHVLATLLHKKGSGIAFAFSMLLHADLGRRAQLIGRIQQNIMLCRKYDVPMVVASFAGRPYEMRSPHDLTALFKDVGMHPKEIMDGWEWLGQKAERPSKGL